MPNFDGTGPMGTGSMTGGGRGMCNPATIESIPQPMGILNFGRHGRGQGFRDKYGRGTGYVDVVVGGQYGREGKGQIAAYLAPEYDVLVRVGGPNAGHKVFEIDEPYTYHHLPSGTLRNQGLIVIGPGATVNVYGSENIKSRGY